MRRSKQPAVEKEPKPAAPTAAPPLTPASLPRVRPSRPDTAPPPPEIDDFERGRTAALLSALGRVTLTLDLIERRLGRVEESIRELTESRERSPADVGLDEGVGVASSAGDTTR